MASVIRLAFLTSMDTLDITYTGIPFILMSLVEPSLAVTLACIPLLRPLFPKTNTRYSATGTRERVVSLSFRGLTTTNSTTTQTCCGHAAAAAGAGGGHHYHHHHHHRRGSSKRCGGGGRSSTTSMPAPILQYQYEMGLSGSKEGMMMAMSQLPVDDDDDDDAHLEPGLGVPPTTGNDYHYRAEVSTGHDSDEHSTGGAKGRDFGGKLRGRDSMDISPTDTSNIMVKQEWIVSNEVKADV